MNALEWFIVGAAFDLQRQDSESWLKLPDKVRGACLWVTGRGMAQYRAETLDLRPLIAALRGPV